MTQNLIVEIFYAIIHTRFYVINKLILILCQPKSGTEHARLIQPRFGIVT